MKKTTGNSPLLNPLLFPFMSSVSNVILHGHLSSTDSSLSKHKDRLTKAWKFTFHPVIGDGNCLFAAIAFALITNEQALLQQVPTFFETRHLETNDQNILGTKLRELTVVEWKNNVDFYQKFLVTSNVVQEADKYLRSGVYCGELGDTMVLALSNALQLVIIAIKDHPIINISPQEIAASTPIFIAFNQYGPGHYDGLIENSTLPPASVPLETVTISHCSCGKNDKKNGSHCHPKTQKYTSVCLCPCCKSGVGCSDNCRCKSCNNPHGKRTMTEQPPSRKRPRHLWQKSVQSSAKFALQLGEHLNHGPRSLLEYFAMEQVLNHCKMQEISETSENILIIYNAMVEIVQLYDCALPLGEKSVSEVETFLREHEHNLDFYKALLCN